MKPTICRMVVYNTTKAEKEEMAINGNAPDELPAVVTNVFGDDGNGGTHVNLKVFYDGPGSGWRTTVSQGSNPGQWDWPKRN